MASKGKKAAAKHQNDSASESEEDEQLIFGGENAIEGYA